MAKKYISIDKARALAIKTGFHSTTMTITEFLDSIPVADVRENVRGEWIPINGAHQWKCSCCGECIGGDADCTPYINNYCWNCGAKMKGEYDEQVQRL